MSHITTLTVQVRDLNALAAAAKELGGALVRDQKTFTAYRNNANKCDHAITLPGLKYQVGVIKDAKTNTYNLAFDPYGYDGHGSNDDGHKIVQKFGEGLKKLVQSYAVNVASMAARAKGWMTQRTTLPNGSIKLTLTGAM